MKDISKFLSTNINKPEITYIRIDIQDGKKYFVATDAFRLARQVIPESISELFEESGFLTKENYKKIVKAYNRKVKGKHLPDLQTVIDTLKLNAVYFENKDYNYPDYNKIIPTETTDFIPLQVNSEYFTDFIELMDEKGVIKNTIDLNDIKVSKIGTPFTYESNKYMYSYKSETILLLLMPV